MQMSKSAIHPEVDVFTGWTADGQKNAALYPPGVSCDAMDGCPVNPHCWSVVTWYPGLKTAMFCFGTEQDAREFLQRDIYRA